MMNRARQILDDADKVVTDLQQVTDPKALGAIVESTQQTTANLAKAIGDARRDDRGEPRGAEDRASARSRRRRDNASQVATDMRNLIARRTRRTILGDAGGPPPGRANVQGARARGPREAVAPAVLEPAGSKGSCHEARASLVAISLAACGGSTPARPATTSSPTAHAAAPARSRRATRSSSSSR